MNEIYVQVKPPSTSGRCNRRLQNAMLFVRYDHGRRCPERWKTISLSLAFIIVLFSRFRDYQANVEHPVVARYIIRDIDQAVTIPGIQRKN